jgi:hypothetical protein
MAQNPIHGLMGMQMPGSYAPQPQGGLGNDQSNWIGVYGIIKRLYPQASDQQILQMLQSSMAGAK